MMQEETSLDPYTLAVSRWLIDLGTQFNHGHRSWAVADRCIKAGQSFKCRILEVRQQSQLPESVDLKEVTRLAADNNLFVKAQNTSFGRECRVSLNTIEREVVVCIAFSGAGTCTLL
jgi:hypothetical protein